ncbi:MAG TPA: hypothetical protein VGT02_18125 [Methylomirabilota bacterium]|nr:hypothetical protein [Methylomirabilota bacterium]
MSRLTADERRRTHELRRSGVSRPTAKAITVDQFELEQPAVAWGRSARVATVVTVALGGLLALLQLAQTLSLYGPGSLLDWLLPRL